MSQNPESGWYTGIIQVPDMSMSYTLRLGDDGWSCIGDHLVLDEKAYIQQFDAHLPGTSDRA